MTAQWNVEALARCRSEGDPLGDAVVADVFAHGERNAVDRLLMGLVENDGLPPESLPPEVVDFLERAKQLPSWKDSAKIQRGEQLFMQYGLTGLASLLCASLPFCYLMKRGIHVLWMTQQLELHVYRRLLETAQMLVAVMTPGGLTPSGGGVVAALKVRLMHAAIRHLILQEAKESTPPKHVAALIRSTRWNPAWGHPINQEDMAYTLLTFGYIIPRGMMALGVRLEPADRDAILHCWNVVGFIMGVREDLIAQNEGEAERLFELIKSTQGGSTPEAIAMTHALIQCIQNVLPRRLLDWLPPAVVRHTLGKKDAAALGVGRASLLTRVGSWAVFRILRAVGALEHLVFRRSIVLRWVGVWIGTRLVRGLSRLPRGGKRGLFFLPKELAASWAIPVD